MPDITYKYILTGDEVGEDTILNTEHERYHEVTIETLQSIEDLMSTQIMYSNLLLTLLVGVTIAVVLWLYHKHK